MMGLLKKLFGHRDDHFDALILLLSDYRDVDEQLVRRVLPEVASNVDVVKRGERILLTSPTFRLSVLSRPMPYGPPGEGSAFLVGRCKDLRMRDVVARHTAFVSVVSDSSTPLALRDMTRRVTTCIAGRLVDETTLSILDAESNRMMIPREATIELLRLGDREGAFADCGEKAVVDVESGSLADEVAEARRRYSEFREAFLRARSGSMFALKMEFTDEHRGHTEHMWIDPTELRNDSITGKLMSDPHLVRSVRNGDTITKPLSELTDWIYVEDGEPHGAFTEAKVRKG